MNEIIHEALAKCEAALKEKLDVISFTNAPAALFVIMDILIACGLEILKAGVRALLEEIARAKDKRRELGWVVKDRSAKRVRTIMTLWGPAELPNPEYIDRKTGHCFSMLNTACGFRKGQKVEETMRRALVDQAVEQSSYRQAADTVGFGSVSTRSVTNFVRQYEVREPAIPEEKRQVPVIELHVDEAHGRVWNEKHEGKHRQLPVAMLCEGTKEAGKKRQTVRPHVFTALSTKELEAQITAYVHQNYDIEFLQEIRVMGDGASWIQKILDDEFPGQVSHFMDKFHITQSLNRQESKFKDLHPRKKLRLALRHKNLSEAIQVFDEMEAAAQNDKDREFVHRHRTYFENNWPSMLNSQRSRKCPSSCTESIVDHVLACRLTAGPYVWSEDVYEKIGQIRACKRNGGSVLVDDPATLSPGSGKEYLKRLFEEEFDLDFSIFDPVAPPPAWDTGTMYRLRQLAAGGQLFGRHGVAAMA